MDLMSRGDDQVPMEMICDSRSVGSGDQISPSGLFRLFHKPDWLRHRSVPSIMERSTGLRLLLVLSGVRL